MKQAAVIDIGSNSIRYACGGIDEAGAVFMEPKRLRTTQLAEGLVHSGRLGEEAMRRSLAAIAEFAADARARNLPIYAYATSAVRDSANRADFCGRVQALGVDAEVLSGEEEGRLALLGATGGKGGILDIGGGSTQITLPGFARSAPIGCVRASELCANARSLDEMRQIVFGRCLELFVFPEESGGVYAGLGGTIHTLAALLLGDEAYDEARVCGVRAGRAALGGLEERLYELGREGRARHPLLRERAETILPGALILSFVMEHMNLKELTVSARDGMEGYLMKKLI